MSGLKVFLYFFFLIWMLVLPVCSLCETCVKLVNLPFEHFHVCISYFNNIYPHKLEDSISSLHDSNWMSTGLISIFCHLGQNYPLCEAYSWKSSPSRVWRP